MLPSRLGDAASVFRGGLFRARSFGGRAMLWINVGRYTLATLGNGWMSGGVIFRPGQERGRRRGSPWNRNSTSSEARRATIEVGFRPGFRDDPGGAGKLCGVLHVS